VDLGLNTTSMLVVEGDSEVMLTPKEQQALAAARTGKGPE
jgi:hypothetical protein